MTSPRFTPVSRAVLCLAALLLSSISGQAQLDQDGNQYGDVWEAFYSASGLSPASDADSDGFTNAQENEAGSNPFDPLSRPLAAMHPGLPGFVDALWLSEPGKLYAVQSTAGLVPGSWQAVTSVLGDGALLDQPLATGGQQRAFFRLQVGDTDSDLDQLTDWEEIRLGFNPNNSHSDRNAMLDRARVLATWNTANTITVGLVDGDMREDWPDPGVIAIRRSGGLQPVTVNLSLTGTALLGTDYTTPTSTQIVIPLGAREAWVSLTPVNDAAVEGSETIIVTAIAGAGYTVGTINSATATLDDASPLPSAKAAARFLLQADFGPNQDSTADADQVPENIEEVMALGFEAWIDDQLARPIGYLQHYVQWAVANGNGIQLYGNYKEHSWWGRVMGSPKLRPDDTTTQLPDFLRQRVAFALSEILVASDRPLAGQQYTEPLAIYYDLLATGAFGSFRDLLEKVTLSPVMGTYLSSVRNAKSDPVTGTDPDENYAREIMQLFTIGLWQLNNDGTRMLDAQGQPIASYDNVTITEMARVFTGMTYADKNFPGSNGNYTLPMKMWDAQHDLGAKTLLNGLALPARTASSGNTGTAGLADVDAAVGNLFNHANVGPFIGRLLIQRLVTSNPSPAYIGRVASAFNNNGSGVRGDMKAVVKAILLDTEARDPAMMELPTWGKLREPFLRVVNLARAFNAASTSGYYPLDQFTTDHLQDPMNSPSVFNFFLPNHSPPGVLTQQGLVAPEFQIINAGTAITGPNYFWSAIGNNSLHRYGSGTAAYVVKLNLDPELGMVVPAAQINSTGPAESGLMDSDPLIRRLDMALTGGTLSPRLFQSIRESIDRVKPSTGSSYNWHRERLRLAIYLILSSADFNVQR